MDIKTLAVVAFVVAMTLAGAVVGRLIWHHSQVDVMKENNPGYSYPANWLMTVIVLGILIWVAAKLKFFAVAGDAAKVVGAFSCLLAMVGLAWRPKWLWK